MWLSRGFSVLFWATSILIWTSPQFVMANVGVRVYFHDELDDDLTKVTWAHAVNSQEELKEALKNDIMMLEADILMGMKDGSDKAVPIMAHPPNTTSDLTFEDFLKKVIKSNNDNKKKGIKLDFKDIEAVVPVMKIIEKNKKRKNADFPIWVNADIWAGPVNATTQPLDPEGFITAINSKDLKPTLSLGWTTRFGNEKGLDTPIAVGHYTDKNKFEALKFLDTSGIDASIHEVTFPVRAGIAAQSIDVLLDLLNRAGGAATLTLWSKKDDPVNMESLENLIDIVGRTRIYADLPFPLPGSSSSITTSTHANHHNKVTTEGTTTSSTTKSSDSKRSKDKQIKDRVITVEKDLVPSTNSTPPHPNSVPQSTSCFLMILSSLLMIFFAFVASQ